MQIDFYRSVAAVHSLLREAGSAQPFALLKRPGKKPLRVYLTPGEARPWSPHDAIPASPPGTVMGVGHGKLYVLCRDGIYAFTTLRPDGAEAMDALRERTRRRMPADLHRYISWFAEFQPKEDRPPASTDREAARARQADRKKQAERARNKAAKKARKKNRR